MKLLPILFLIFLSVSSQDIESPPEFNEPSLDTRNAYFYDLLNDRLSIGKSWIKSVSKKEGIDENISKYNGEWKIGVPERVVLQGDYSLIAISKARHHAIASGLKKPFKFEDTPLILQYEVRYEEGQECGGGYLKLLHSNISGSLKEFNDKSPYVIMFGPDKCGMTSKIHLILRHKNPLNGSINEHHAKQSSKSLSSFFDDKQTHLYKLVIGTDNTYKVYVDHNELMSGSLLNDLDPPVEPPKEIFDPADVKPADWDDREMIEDKDAWKPDDWDENQPKEIPDEDAVKPNDWLEEADPLVPDSESRKPTDWDEEMDGEWEPKKIPNPECEGRSGCGPWTRPMKSNPLYKGKWVQPKIKNPNYKGKWTPRLIQNPHYFVADPFRQLESISAIGIELWTMSPNIHFDNIILTGDEKLTDELSKRTFDIKITQEKVVEKSSLGSESAGFVGQFVQQFLDETEDKPWLWAVAILVILIPIVGISIFCFGRKTQKVHPKKDDDFKTEDDPTEEFEQVELESIDPDQQATSSGGLNESAQSQEESSQSSSQASSAQQSPSISKQHLAGEKEKADETSMEQTKKSPNQRRLRARRME